MITLVTLVCLQYKYFVHMTNKFVYSSGPMTTTRTSVCYGYENVFFIVNKCVHSNAPIYYHTIALFH